MYSWTHVCWMCVRLFYILFLFFMLGIFVLGIFVLEKVVDISYQDGILIFKI